MLEVFQRIVVWECLGIILVAISSDKKTVWPCITVCANQEHLCVTTP